MDEARNQQEIDNLFTPRRHRDNRGTSSEAKRLHDQVRHLCQYYLWPAYREGINRRAQGWRQRARDKAKAASPER